MLMKMKLTWFAVALGLVAAGSVGGLNEFGLWSSGGGGEGRGSGEREVVWCAAECSAPPTVCDAHHIILVHVRPLHRVSPWGAATAPLTGATAGGGIIVSSPQGDTIPQRDTIPPLPRYTARTSPPVAVTLTAPRTNSLLHRSFRDARPIASIRPILKVAAAAVGPVALVDVGIAGVMVELLLVRWWRRRWRGQVTLGGGVALLVWRWWQPKKQQDGGGSGVFGVACQDWRIQCRTFTSWKRMESVLCDVRWCGKAVYGAAMSEFELHRTEGKSNDASTIPSGGVEF